MDKLIVVCGTGYGTNPAVTYECLVQHANGVRQTKAITRERIDSLLAAGYTVYWNPTRVTTKILN